MLVLLLSLPISAFADNITTAEMGNTIKYLETKATCEEVNNAIRTQGMNSEHDAMIVLAVLTFQLGYAKGKNISQKDALLEMLTYCSENPKERFLDIPN